MRVLGEEQKGERGIKSLRGEEREGEGEEGGNLDKENKGRREGRR
jgi:hypothetical protein